MTNDTNTRRAEIQALTKEIQQWVNKPRASDSYDRVKVEQMLDDGCSHWEVHRTLGVNRKWLSANYPDRGWPQGGSRQLSEMIRLQRALDRL